MQGEGMDGLANGLANGLGSYSIFITIILL